MNMFFIINNFDQEKNVGVGSASLSFTNLLLINVFNCLVKFQLINNYIRI